ncbi:MAG: DUF6017 domain-containing protein [Ethanoligenens sp.]
MPQKDNGQGYIRIPRVLFKSKKYAGLRPDAKLLYGILLDRLCLSQKNHWADENGRTYVYCSIKEIMDTFECQQGKAEALLKGLDKYGLIERKRSPNKPSRIYVREFVLVSQGPDGEECDVPPLEDDLPEPDLPKPGTPNSISSINRNCENRNTGNCNAAKGSISAGSTKSKPSASAGLSNVVDFPQAVETPVKEETGIAKNNDRNCDFPHPELRKPQRSYPEFIYPECSDPYLPPLVPTDFGGADGSDIRKTVYKNIEYDILRQKYADDLPRLDSLVSRIVEALCSTRKTMRVNSEDIPSEDVKARLLSLNDGHIDYAMDVMRDRSGNIGNSRAFALTVLYNAPLQMDEWYDNKTRHDAECEQFEQSYAIV